MPEMGTESHANRLLLEDTTYGLSAIETLVDDLETRLTALRAATLDKTGRVWEWKNLDWIDTSLTINEWMTSLDTVDDVKVYYLLFEQTNDAASVENIALEVTIDGTALTLTVGAASGEITYVRLTNTGGITHTGSVVTQMLAQDVDQSAPLETKSLKIRVRQTTSVDTTSAQIEVNMIYCQMEAT